MAPNIRVDDEIYDFLKRHAEPFVDSPNSVLRRLFNFDRPTQDVVDEPKSASKRTSPDSRGKRSSARPKGHKRPRRAAPGSLLPEGEYVHPLLSALDEKGGSAAVRDVIESVGKKLDGRLTASDHGRLASGTIRWQNRVQFTRLRLVEEGIIAKDSPRGLWTLTEAGRQRLAELQG